MPRFKGETFGLIAGGAVGVLGSLGAGTCITALLGSAIGYEVGGAVGPSESSIDAEMPNDVKTAIGVIRSGNSYQKPPGFGVF
jgi:hypothetical protein